MRAGYGMPGVTSEKAWGAAEENTTGFSLSKTGVARADPAHSRRVAAARTRPVFLIRESFLARARALMRASRVSAAERVRPFSR